MDLRRVAFDEPSGALLAGPTGNGRPQPHPPPPQPNAPSQSNSHHSHSHQHNNSSADHALGQHQDAAAPTAAAAATTTTAAAAALYASWHTLQQQQQQQQRQQAAAVQQFPLSHCAEWRADNGAIKTYLWPASTADSQLCDAVYQSVGCHNGARVSLAATPQLQLWHTGAATLAHHCHPNSAALMQPSTCGAAAEAQFYAPFVGGGSGGCGAFAAAAAAAAATPDSLAPKARASRSRGSIAALSAGDAALNESVLVAEHFANGNATGAQIANLNSQPNVNVNPNANVNKDKNKNKNNCNQAATANEQPQAQAHQPKQLNSKVKSLVTQLVLASNVPFAYAIVLVAFLITIVAATSIIIVLTIVLTITGYTAYPITESQFNTSLAIGVVCASFALALVTGSLIVWRRHCQAAYYYLDEPQNGSRGTSSPQLSETFDDSEYGSIVVNDWAKHVQKLHADSDIGFAREFEQIQKADQTHQLTCEHSQMAENKHKNRYINIVAYDHTRVLLRPLQASGKQSSDYVNANYIDGYNKPRAYIGTQGPLVSTFEDYWRMVWEQRVVIIVMITNLQERGRRKCDMYWPKEGSETYGKLQVKLLQEVVMATYTLRTFSVRNLKLKKRSGSSERTVYQYHYTNWPDHGVPDHPLPVLSFVRKSASANPSAGGPIICHCSAGCGRSGTYIVIDAMLRQMRHKQSINVVDFLKHIRTQRNYLVQTEQQYIFIHDVLVEAIDAGETEISSSFIGKYIQLLQTGGVNKCSTYSFAQDLQTVAGQPQTALSVDLNNNNNSNSNSNNSASNGLVGSQSNLLLSAASSHLTMDPKQQQQQQQSQPSAAKSPGEWSLLERQYRQVASFKAKDYCVVTALKPYNQRKNRTLNLVPLEINRVHITSKPGVEGSDYINASFLMGFNHLREFIVTQHPVYETFSDFWQMVYDHNSQTIVLLTQMTNDLIKEFPQFWPQKEDEVDYGSFKVKLIEERIVPMASAASKAANGDSPFKGHDNLGHSPATGACTPSSQIIARDFIMRSNQDDYELQTRIIHCPGWPESCGPLAAVFDLIQYVQNCTQQHASQQRMHDAGHTRTQTVTIGQEHEPQNGGPVIVVDKFGGTEAATFAVLTTLYKQINFEDAVDVYMYAKLAHLRRPGIWSSQDDYLFLYRAMENYATNAASLAAAAAQSAVSQANSNSNNNSNHNNDLANPSMHIIGTMTLDRHKHKSSNSKALNTSTMRRTHHAHKTGLTTTATMTTTTTTTLAATMTTAPSTTMTTATTPVMQPLIGQQQSAAEFAKLTSPSQKFANALDLNLRQQQLASGLQQQQQQQHQLHRISAHLQTNQIIGSMQQQQQQPQPNHLTHYNNGAADNNNYTAAIHMSKALPTAKGSPYNSATSSIGAGSHQHLLAASNGGGGGVGVGVGVGLNRGANNGYITATLHGQQQQQQPPQQQPQQQTAQTYLYPLS